MDYKKMMGYDNKPKTKQIKKTKKSSLTENLMKEFGGLEMGKVYTDKNLPPFKTEQKINEGPAGDYAPYLHAINQNYDKYWDSIKDFQKVLDKKGLKGASKGIGNSYKNLVLKFHKLFGKIINKLQ